MIDIDGSLYSGSGTIVCQAVSYAALTARAVRVRNARAGRPHPGLRPQHLRAIQAIRELVSGTLEGAEMGSRSFTFRPGSTEPAGRYRWDIKTAGSAPMLALAALPVMALRGHGAEAEIHGGLFGDFTPSVSHLQHVIMPMLARMGIVADLDVIRPGYVPASQGVIRLKVQRARRPLRPLTPRRGRLPARIWGISLASHLSDPHAAARMAASARTVLDAADSGGIADITERTDATDATAAQPGATCALFADFIGDARLSADRAGPPHLRAEEIGASVARQLLEDIACGATIDRHTSDQIIPFAALASGTSRFTIPFLTEHIRASAWLASVFLGADIHAQGQALVIRGQGAPHPGAGPPAERDPLPSLTSRAQPAASR